MASEDFAATVVEDTRVESQCSFYELLAPGSTAVTPDDPTTVVCKVRDPAGTQTTYTYGSDAELTKTATGVYSMKLLLDSPGIWWFEWVGSSAGGPQVTKDVAFRVTKKVMS